MQLRMMHYYDLDSALNTLREGGNLLLPTDTIWSIACKATDERAVQKMEQTKERSGPKPCIVLVDSLEMLKRCVTHVHPRIETLLHFHQRPLTVLYKPRPIFPTRILGTDGTVAIRVVQDESCKALIQSFGHPLAVTAAKFPQEPLPYYFSDISILIKERVDFVFDLPSEKPLDQRSVIARLSERGELEFLRE
ncbi:MAG: Sua5/YciO/YrdC/YwlC family protein [Bacteroidota bacterium]